MGYHHTVGAMSMVGRRNLSISVWASSVGLSLLSQFLAAPCRGQPTQMPFQGELRQSGIPHTGLTPMKFAILDGATTLWSNDGTSVGGSQPASPVSVSVAQGLFSVQLGASPMSPLDPSSFAPATAPVLRMWVDTGSGFEQLSDQALGSTAFALVSDYARQSTGDFVVNGDTLRVGGLMIRDISANTVKLDKTVASGAAVIDIDPIPQDGTGAASVRFFRNTSTTGAKYVAFLKGDLSSATSARIGVGGDNSFFQLDGGNCGIATSSPNVRLHVDGGTDASMSGGTGYLVLGAISGQNIVMDDNEVIARNNGAETPLHLQAMGGDLRVHATAAGTEFIVTDAGRVGIGTLTPNGQAKLDVIGYIRCTGLSETSSRSLKHDIAPIESALDRLGALQGVTFTWNDDHGGGRDIGLIAEDVAQIFPELVTWEEGGSVASGLKYNHLVAVLVEAMKEQQVQVDAQSAAMEQLRRRMEEQRQELEALRALVRGRAWSEKADGTR